MSFRNVAGLLAGTALFFSAAGSAHAAVANPAPTLYGADDGTLSFTPAATTITVGSFFIGADITSLGFYYANASSSFVQLLAAGQANQFDVVNFATGKVTNTTSNTTTSFTPGTGPISFYAVSTLGGTAHTLANTATPDPEATFPKLGDPTTYIVGFADPATTPQTSAYLTVTPVTPTRAVTAVPEPSSLVAMLTGLGLLGGLTAFGRRNSSRS